MHTDPWRRTGLVLKALMAIALLGFSGCDEVGVVASKVVGDSDTPASYAGLKGEHVGVMVWADAGIVIDHPRIFADISNSLHSKLQQAQDAEVKELVGTKFLPNNQILQFQDAHPEFQSDSAEQIAIKLPVTRLIYIEVASLSLHPNDSLDLSRGQAVANVKVIEVADGKAKSAYENDNISGVYPPHSPPEGMPGLDDETVYHKSIDALTTELAKLFISHPTDTHETDPLGTDTHE